MDFATWYTNKHGYAPFPWQLRLAGQVQNGQWPEEITLPTGTGKTSIVDIWAWAHDAGVSGIPTRLCYVIDRRLVVDSVTAHAESLGVNVVKMRGGMLPDDSWLMDPRQPTVIVSTVDQVGSRLLWRGYGISARVTPVHAGLIGNDTLIVLDEAHISTPFATTLEGIEGYRQDTLRLPWQVVRMTATPTGDEGFSLDQDDQAHPVLKPRLEAKRLANLDSASEDAFISKLVTHAEQLRTEGAQVVGVVCNTVNDARSVFARLPGEKVLLTGRIRPADKDAILTEYLPRMAAGSRSKGRAMLYAVATQTIEVGADLDFDGLVTEWAPIDSLRQRFGRVDRLGELGTSQSVIVRKKVTKDFVYGIKVLRDAWKWLNGVATGKGKHKAVDWGLLSMNATVTENPPPLRPLPETKPLLPTDIRRLRQTEPRVAMDIAPWLHGVDADSATVQVAWRIDIALDNVDQWPEIIAETPPVVGELMPCPVGEVRRWLDNRVALANGQVVTAGEIRPGDTLVVPSTYGGYDRWGWAPNSRETVTDIGNVVERKRTRIRLHPALYPDHESEIQSLVIGTANVKEVLSAIGIDVARPVITSYPGGMLVTNANPRVNGKEVKLADHLPGVGDVAERITPGGLDEAIRKTVITAARQHDIGKTDPRFQAMLGAKGELLAKSAHRSPTEALQARYWSGLPEGWRHELASVAKLPETASNLLRYLVGTHHGFGRTVLPIGGDPGLWHQAGGPVWSGMTQHLNASYGPWALAYLESLVRLSDWIRSQEERERA